MKISIRPDLSLYPTDYGPFLSDLYARYNTGVISINGSILGSNPKPFIILQRNINLGTVTEIEVESCPLNENLKNVVHDEIETFIEDEVVEESSEDHE